MRSRGTGSATLCERCNNVVTGSWYVPEFCKWVEAAVRTIQMNPEIRARDNDLDPRARFELKGATRAVCQIKRDSGLAAVKNCRLATAPFPLELAQEGPRADEMVVEDLAGDIKKLRQ